MNATLAHVLCSAAALCILAAGVRVRSAHMWLQATGYLVLVLGLVFGVLSTSWQLRYPLHDMLGFCLMAVITAQLGLGVANVRCASHHTRMWHKHHGYAWLGVALSVELVTGVTAYFDLCADDGDACVTRGMACVALLLAAAAAAYIVARPVLECAGVACVTLFVMFASAAATRTDTARGAVMPVMSGLACVFAAGVTGRTLQLARRERGPPRVASRGVPSVVALVLCGAALLPRDSDSDYTTWVRFALCTCFVAAACARAAADRTPLLAASLVYAAVYTLALQDGFARRAVSVPVTIAAVGAAGTALVACAHAISAPQPHVPHLAPPVPEEMT